MIHVAYAERHILVRDAMTRYLEETADLRVAIVASSEEDLMNRLICCEKLPDVSIFGTPKEDFKGYAILQQLRKAYPRLKVLILTACQHPIALMLMAHYGANGYRTLNTSKEELLLSIKAIQSGGQVYEPAILKKLVQMFGTRKRVRGMCYLSAAEIKIMELTNEHLCTKQIAASMNISYNSAVTLMNRTYAKLQVATKEALLHELYEIGM